MSAGHLPRDDQAVDEGTKQKLPTSALSPHLAHRQLCCVLYTLATLERETETETKEENRTHVSLNSIYVWDVVAAWKGFSSNSTWSVLFETSIFRVRPWNLHKVFTPWPTPNCAMRSREKQSFGPICRFNIYSIFQGESMKHWYFLFLLWSVQFSETIRKLSISIAVATPIYYIGIIT